jgi:hypothetical protein
MFKLTLLKIQQTQVPMSYPISNDENLHFSPAKGEHAFLDKK